MQEHAERPELREDEMSGLAPDDWPVPGWDTEGVPADVQDVPADVQDEAADVQDDVEDAWTDVQDVAAEVVEAAWAQEPRPVTGEPRVDAALARLDELAGRPVTEHRAVFEDVHRRLRDVLGELDAREQNHGDQPAAAGAQRRAGR